MPDLIQGGWRAGKQRRTEFKIQTRYIIGLKDLLSTVSSRELGIWHTVELVNAAGSFVSLPSPSCIGTGEDLILPMHILKMSIPRLFCNSTKLSVIIICTIFLALNAHSYGKK